MNAPAGDVDGEPAYTGDELDDLLFGARLDRYSPGTGEHEGNVMAVFVRDDGREIGLTFDDSSSYPENRIGSAYVGHRIESHELAAHMDRKPGRLPQETPRIVLEQTSRNDDDRDATIYLTKDHNVEEIIVRNTVSFGLYDVTG